MWKHTLSRLVIALTPPILLSLVRRLRYETTSILFRAPLSECKRLHLGCGSNLLDGWINVDVEGPRGAIRWDLRNPLPVESGTVSHIFCEHFIEHVTFPEATELLAECHRVLRPGGILRISTPDLQMVINQYLAGRLCEWIDVGWEPSTPCQMVNEGMRLWGHQFVYDAAELTRILEEIGFHEVARVPWRESKHQDLAGLECRPFHGEIIVEAVK